MNMLKKKLNKKGFTLAELLIVVAIIAVLVAISIPIFTSQLEKSKDSTDQANIRAAYAELAVQLLDGTISLPTTGTATKEFTIDGKGTNDKWDNLGSGESFKIGNADGAVTVAAVAKFKKVTFTYDTTGKVTACALSAS